MSKIDVIRKFLNGGLDTKVYLGKSIDEFKQSFNYMQSNIKELENENEELTKGDNNQILKTVKVIKERYLNNPVDNKFSCFADAWIYLVFNWNNNTIKSPTIKEECDYVHRLIEDFLTMKEVLDNLKYVNDRLKNFKSWNPPAFEVSKHFIEYLD